jgi:peptidoglycan/xylan/chitin deacetylase (PgdA/CDA1 family)
MSMVQQITQLPGENETQKRPWAPILMYHRVVPQRTEKDPYNLCTTVGEFEAQMRFLAMGGYRSATLEDLLCPEHTHARTDHRQVAITFDDGYLDVFQYALPVLAKYGFSATMFLVADYLGRSNSWDNGKAEQVPLLGPLEIDQMRNSGISFGSHSLTHRYLASLSAEDAWEEISGSKARLKDEFGIEASTFCYPYGNTSSEVREIVAQAGYLGACGIDRARDSQFELSRIDAAACRGAGLLWRMKVSGSQYKLRNSQVARLVKSWRNGAGR